MTLLSRKADYALLILSHLHHAADGGNARAIAERFGLSRAFVANILKELCHKGYVASTRGVKGGYSLLRPARDVTLAELLESIDEGFRLTVCNGHSDMPAAGDGCSLEHICPLKGPLAEIHRRLADVLRGVTLAELFDQPRAEVVQLLPLLTARSAESIATA
jgi:Rrf2 family transcriptional regulator, cysteine metabolism repressor